MITKVGIFLRKMRIDNHQILKDMADCLNVSSAFLSAIENGKKTMPETMIEKIISNYSLSDEMANDLRKAVEESADIIELNLKNLPEDYRMLAVSFARKFESMDTETREKLNAILNR